jgi:hypothetical protein
MLLLDDQTEATARQIARVRAEIAATKDRLYPVVRREVVSRNAGGYKLRLTLGCGCVVTRRGSKDPASAACVGTCGPIS